MATKLRFFRQSLLPCFGPLIKINTNKDLGRLPQLNNIDNVLEHKHREASYGKELHPGQLDEERVYAKVLHPIHFCDGWGDNVVGENER